MYVDRSCLDSPLLVPFLHIPDNCVYRIRMFYPGYIILKIQRLILGSTCSKHRYLNEVFVEDL